MLKNEQAILKVLSTLAEMREILIQHQMASERIVEELVNLSDAICNPHTFATYVQVMNVPSKIRAEVFKILSHRKQPREYPIAVKVAE